MANIQVPNEAQVDQKSQTIFGQLKKQLGSVPNLYATIGYSSNTLEQFLNFSGPAGKQTFSNSEIEAIKLAVSEVNECAYCLAAHTALGKMNGFSEEETIELRTGTVANPRLKAITQLAGSIAQNRGHAKPKYVEQFFTAGFNEGGLIDLIAVVTAVTFTNYVHGSTKVPVDFPQAPVLTAVL